MNAQASLLLVALSTSCGGLGLAREQQSLTEMYVQDVKIPSAYSGVIASYVKIDVRKAGRAYVLAYPYLDRKTKVPISGTTCDFDYTETELSGLVGEQFVDGEPFKLARSFICSP